MDFIAKKLYAETIDQKLYNFKTKSSAINYIYKVVEPYTKGFFRDESWEHLHKVFKVINDLGVDLNWWVEDGGYKKNDLSQSKVYQLEIQYMNAQGNIISIKGHLTAHAAGSIADVWDRYDMSLVMY